MKPFRIISLKECAEDLDITPRYMRWLFHRSDPEFLPVFRINQIAFFMRYDFESWKQENWQELCTMELCTA